MVPSLILMLLAGGPPLQSASKPAAPTARSSRPSPERVQSLKATIEKRRKRLAERHRIAEKYRNAFDRELRANARIASISARSATILPGGDRPNPNAGMPIRVTDSPPFGRADPFPADGPPPGGGIDSLKPCFT